MTAKTTSADRPRTGGLTLIGAAAVAAMPLPTLLPTTAALLSSVGIDPSRVNEIVQLLLHYGASAVVAQFPELRPIIDMLVGFANSGLIWLIAG